MLRSILAILTVSLTLCFSFVFGQEQQSPKAALQAVGLLVGDWRGTGVPVGSLDDQRKNFWVESIHCAWKFRGNDVWLVFAFDKSKHYRAGELRFLPAEKLYQLSLKTVDDKSIEFRGDLKNKNLTLESTDGTQKLVFTLLHDNRYLYRQEVRAEGKRFFAKSFQVGATKEGVPFAVGSQPECIVTGGLGTSTVSYQGKTYYVCCSGCRDEFNADPARYVKEYESRKGKK